MPRAIVSKELLGFPRVFVRIAAGFEPDFGSFMNPRSLAQLFQRYN
jgi:hypothetical protein